MHRWGPLPDTTDLFIFWAGPGTELYLTKGEHGLHKRIEHHSAAGIHHTLRSAQNAVDAFVAAYNQEGTS